MSCLNFINQSIWAECSNPKIAGFTGRAIIYSIADWSARVTWTHQTGKPNVITAVTVEEQDMGVKVEFYGPSPFTGTNRALTTEDGDVKYTETFALRVPNRDVSGGNDVIEPLARGRYIVVAETEDAHVFMFGLFGKLTATEQTQNEYENGGDWMVTMSGKTPYAVTEIVGTPDAATNPETAIEIFEAMWANAR